MKTNHLSLLEMAKRRLIGLMRIRNKMGERKPVFFPKITLSSMDKLKSERQKKGRKSYYMYKKKLVVRPEYLYRVKFILNHRSIIQDIFKIHLGIPGVQKRDYLLLSEYCRIQKFLTEIAQELSELPVRPRSKQDFYVIRKTISQYFVLEYTFDDQTIKTIKGQRKNFDSQDFIVPYQRTIEDLIRDIRLNYIDRCQYEVQQDPRQT